MTKVMIVDDAAFMVKVAIKNLENAGYETVSAADGQECMDMIEEEKPDVILLDAEMPVMDGWETCEELKSNETTKDIPVIMCTGDDAEEYIERAKQLGAKGYLVKPYQIEAMKEKIEEALSG